MAAAEASTQAGSTASAASKEVKVALCQMTVVEDKTTNLDKAKAMVAKAAADGANLVVLPEIFNGPYATSAFASFAEPVPEVVAGGDTTIDAKASPSIAMLSQAAKDNGVFLIGGSVAERSSSGTEDEADKLYNTCTVWSPTGRLLAKHRKMHLFDIDVPGRITFRESDTLTAGDSLTAFDTPWGRVGVGICYDVRFPQLSMLLRHTEHCDMLVFPGAFNTTTGPAHWELLLRSRAVDNQVFVLACSPARNPDASYQAFGHSSVVDPWGEVIATTAHGEDTVTATLDMQQAQDVRTRIPVASQRRLELYSDVAWAGKQTDGILGSTRAACAKIPGLGGLFA